MVDNEIRILRKVALDFQQVVKRQTKIIKKLEKQINTIFDAIKHGDKKHRQWLRRKIKSHFDLKT